VTGTAGVSVPVCVYGHRVCAETQGKSKRLTGQTYTLSQGCVCVGGKEQGGGRSRAAAAAGVCTSLIVSDRA
jgi:hypothetical protein